MMQYLQSELAVGQRQCLEAVHENFLASDGIFLYNNCFHLKKIKNKTFYSKHCFMRKKIQITHATHKQVWGKDQSTNLSIRHAHPSDYNFLMIIFTNAI